MPFNLKRDGSNPAIVLPHGGPTGQTTDYFNRTVIALVTRGYICIAPNVRGSTGYGMDFQRANYKDLGGGDLQDEVYAAKFLQRHGLRGCEENRHHRRLLWRLHDDDGHRQDARCLGRGSRVVRHHQLADDAAT